MNAYMKRQSDVLDHRGCHLLPKYPLKRFAGQNPDLQEEGSMTANLCVEAIMNLFSQHLTLQKGQVVASATADSNIKCQNDEKKRMRSTIVRQRSHGKS